MSEFVDETEALAVNMEGIKGLSDSLATFNESFASWLYIMNMNALTTDWTQVRRDALLVCLGIGAEVVIGTRLRRTRRSIWRSAGRVCTFPQVWYY
jgi:hypothetical protein